MDAVLALLKPRGTVLLSGLLESQAEELCAHYAAQIELTIAGEKDGWVGLRGSKPHKTRRGCPGEN